MEQWLGIFLMTEHFLIKKITITSFHFRSNLKQTGPVEIKFEITTQLQIKSHSLFDFCFTNADGARERFMDCEDKD